MADAFANRIVNKWGIAEDLAKQYAPSYVHGQDYGRLIRMAVAPSQTKAYAPSQYAVDASKLTEPVS
jgi:hypothetical protein